MPKNHIYYIFWRQEVCKAMLDYLANRQPERRVVLENFWELSQNAQEIAFTKLVQANYCGSQQPSIHATYLNEFFAFLKFGNKWFLFNWENGQLSDTTFELKASLIDGNDRKWDTLGYHGFIDDPNPLPHLKC